MSVYLSPNHNRLLDLERHLRGQQPGGSVSSRRSLGRSDRQRPIRPSLKTPPLPRAQRQPSPQSQPLGYQPLAQSLSQPLFQPLSQPLREPPTPRQPRPQPAQPRRRTQASSGSYRQLAAQLGKHYHVTPQARTSDLPAIPTPASPDIVETVSASPTAKPFTQPRRPAIASPIRRMQANNAPDRRDEGPFAPTEDSTKAPKPRPPLPVTPQVSWKSLAMTIRQAKLGGTTPEPSATPPAAKPQQAVMDWVIDDIFTAEAESVSEPADPETSGTMPENISSDSIPLEDIPTNAITTENFVTKQLPAKDLPAAAITIDVTPIESKPESDRGINTQNANAAGSNNTLNNTLLLLVYQLACPPQIVNYLAQLQRKHPKRKHPKRKRHKQRHISSASLQKRLRSHPNAS
ncbi:MAG: hypothetical protein AAGF01_19290 [Cyanobacteria bacterium P01_G01_bin.38]